MSGPLDTYVSTLFGRAPDDALIEIRQVGPPRQEWHPVRALDRAAERILELGRKHDTYIGIAPRCRREGGKAAIRRCYVLHADCDTEDSVDRLARFEPAPTLVVWSGSGGLHGYWNLRSAVPVELAEAANRRLARHLGADAASVDASRILRPPATANFKHSPPAPVVLDRWRGATYRLAQVAGHLPDPPEPRQQSNGQRPVDSADVLLTIAPAVYFKTLAGTEVGHDSKTRCPLPDHQDADPSCHVYDDADRGWYCYGCGRGGSIYDLARELSGIGDRGGDFHELRDWIARRLLHAPVREAA
jgi:hypothetical protein